MQYMCTLLYTLPLCLDTRNCALDGTGHIDVEEWSVQTLHHCNLCLVSCGVFQLSVDVAGRFRSVDAVIIRSPAFEILGLGVVELLAVCLVSGGCCTRGASNLSYTENWLPSLEGIFAVNRRIAKAGVREGTLGPTIIDACEMPLHALGCSVSIELVANIDQVLNRGKVDVVDGREVNDDGLQCWSMIVYIDFLAWPWTWVVPRAVSRPGVAVWICALRLFEDDLAQIVQIVVRVWIVKPRSLVRSMSLIDWE